MSVGGMAWCGAARRGMSRCAWQCAPWRGVAQCVHGHGAWAAVHSMCCCARKGFIASAVWGQLHGPCLRLRVLASGLGAGIGLCGGQKDLNMDGYAHAYPCCVPSTLSSSFNLPGPDGGGECGLIGCGHIQLWTGGASGGGGSGWG